MGISTRFDGGCSCEIVQTRHCDSLTKWLFEVHGVLSSYVQPACCACEPMSERPQQRRNESCTSDEVLLIKNKPS